MVILSPAWAMQAIAYLELSKHKDSMPNAQCPMPNYLYGLPKALGGVDFPANPINANKAIA